MQTIKRLLLNLKNIKMLAIVPILIIFVLLPFLNYLDYSASRQLNDVLYYGIVNYTKIFLPFLSVWAIIFTYREYVEGDGSEVLFVNGHKVKIIDGVMLFAAYILLITILYWGYSFLFQEIWIEYFAMLCVCLLYFGLSYFLIFVTKSTVITMMLLLVYAVYTPFYNFDKTSIFNYAAISKTTILVLQQRFFPLAILGLLFVGFGLLANRYMRIN